MCPFLLSLQHMKEDVHLAEACVMEREHEDDGSGSSVETYTYTCVLAINPGAFRSIDALVRGRGGANGNFDAKDGKSHSNNDVGGDANANATSRGEGKESRLEILDLAVHEDASQAEDEAGARRRREDNERSSTSRSDSSSAGVVTEAMRCVTINTPEVRAFSTLPQKKTTALSLSLPYIRSMKLKDQKIVERSHQMMGK